MEEELRFVMEGKQDFMHAGMSDRYVLEREDTFDAPALDRTLWLPYYLPQWSSRERSAARYRLYDGHLHLSIDSDQPAWCPEFDGANRVSSLQTGVFAGPLGSSIGQHRFAPQMVVREEQVPVALYTPLYGFFELRARAVLSTDAMVAFWMIGYEDEPRCSAEICVCEIFGRNVESNRTGIGMGVHPFGDPTIIDEFSTRWFPIDPGVFHLYAVEWTPERVTFFIDGKLVKVVPQSPVYPMQFMLGIYKFPEDGANHLRSSPSEFVIDYFRGFRRR